MAYLTYIYTKIIIGAAEQIFSFFLYKYGMGIGNLFVVAATLAELAGSFHGVHFKLS